MKVNIFGSTGLVGGFLLQACLDHKQITEVRIFVRKPIALQHPKLQQVVTTFETLEQVKHEIQGDVLFNCLGTTLKTAGSKEAQYQIDCEYPVRVARFAAEMGVKVMVNVSSVGAGKGSNFYLNTKYEMEEGVRQAIGQYAYFVRPSLIEGDRKEHRLGEKIGAYLSKLFNPLLPDSLKKYHSIHARQIAKAMLNTALTKPEMKILHYEEMIRLQ